MRRHDTSAWTGRPVIGSNSNGAGGLAEAGPQKAPALKREHVPYRDAVTNLPNRFLLADRLRQALRQSQRRGQTLAVAYLDIDGVKAVGETHGRAACDELLVCVSQRMKQALREGDTLARLNGDEFVAILVDLHAPQDSEPVLDRLVLVASDPINVGDLLVHVKASIGITLYPQGSVDVDLLLRHAEQAFCSHTAHGHSRYQMFDLDLSDSQAGVQVRSED